MSLGYYSYMTGNTTEWKYSDQVMGLMVIAMLSLEELFKHTSKTQEDYFNLIDGLKVLQELDKTIRQSIGQSTEPNFGQLERKIKAYKEKFQDNQEGEKLNDLV